MSPPQPPSSRPWQSAGTRAQTFVSRFLWTTIPFLTVGILGWVPALHVARQRRTARAWWWFWGLLAATAGEFLLVELVPAKGSAWGTFAGAFCLVYIITATVYAWKSCVALPPLSGPPPQYPDYPNTVWISSGAAPIPAPTIQASTVSPSAAGYSAASDMAAEVQAELRELRGLLGGEDAR
jgi:hypothetical protein